MNDVLQLLLWKHSSFLQEVQPKRAFVRFFENDTEFSDELCALTCTTCRSVICADGGTRTQQLFTQDASFLGLGQRSVELYDSQCEAFRPALKMFEILHSQTLACDFGLYRDRAHSAIVWFYFFNLTFDF